MLYYNNKIHIVSDIKRKNFYGYDYGKNCVEIPTARVDIGINYITLVDTEGYQGRFFYITKEELENYIKPYPNKTAKENVPYTVYAPPISRLHEIPINQIDLYAIRKEDYDIKESKKSKFYRNTIAKFEQIIMILRLNGANIYELPLNDILQDPNTISMTTPEIKDIDTIQEK